MTISFQHSGHGEIAGAQVLDSVLGNPVEISASQDHTSSPTFYIVDTTAAAVDITIPFGITASFIVRDQKKKFDTNSCTIKIKDSGGSIIHTAELDVQNREYYFYFDGTEWNFGKVGKGKIVAISSVHLASVDFTNEEVFGSELEVFRSGSQSNTSGASAFKVNATTALKPKGEYRIGFYCDITNADGTDIWEVQFLVNGTPIHEHGNGGDLYQNKPDGNNDWSSESSVAYLTLEAPATIDLDIKFGTNDNTARASNATIEIWRVS